MLNEQQQQQQLLRALQSLSQTGSLAQREATWGVYKRVAAAGAGAHTMASETLLQLIELVAGDGNVFRALRRIALILADVTARRRLTSDEAASARRLWEKIEAACEDPGAWAPFVRAPRPDAAGRRPEEPSGRAAAAGAPESGPAAAAPGPAEVDAAVEELRLLLRARPIRVDPASLWRAYRTVIRGQTAAPGACRLTGDDMRRLIIHCCALGAVSGGRFLTQIEVDLATDPGLFPDGHLELILAYAKLGLLEHSRRLYAGVVAGGSVPASTAGRYMWLALFSAQRHKEGRALFERLAAGGHASPNMYAVLVREYVLIKNKDRAFAIFDDMCSRGVRATVDAANMLAAACALETDPGASGQRLRSVVAWMRSWRISPTRDFFFGLLKGYDQTGQHDMFDGLAARLRTRDIESSGHFGRIVMNNAVRRRDAGRALDMARVVARRPENAPLVVRALCAVDRAEAAAALAGLDAYPENNITANARLQLAMGGAGAALEPEQLVARMEEMLARGFTPEPRVLNSAIQHIWLHGGREKAIQAYERLAGAGAHSNIGVQALMLRLYARSSSPGPALGVLDRLRGLWAAADYAEVSPPFKDIGIVLSLTIAERGIEAARDALDFLATLPTAARNLPVTPVVEYYINHGMADQAQELICRMVQQGVEVDARGANVCCRHLAQSRDAVGLANFMRHLERTRTLRLLADDVFEAFFALCAQQYRLADFEWALGALVRLGRGAPLWQRVIECLAAGNARLLSTMVHALVRPDDGTQRMARLLLHAAQRSRARVPVADMVLAALRRHRARPTAATSDLALAALVAEWRAQRAAGAGAGAGAGAAPAYVASVLDDNLDAAAAAGVQARLLTAALLILASHSRLGHRRCLAVVRGLPQAQRSAAFYGAIARGCVRFGSIGDINDVLRAMEADRVGPTAPLLSAIMECYTVLGSRGDPLLARPGHAGAAAHHPAGGAREECLARVLSVWGEFDRRGLAPTNRACATVLLALAQAGRYAQGEEFVGELAGRGIAHSEGTALMWIRLRLAQGDVGGALRVFSAVGSAAHCARLVAGDARYRGLDGVSRAAGHFAAFIEHYAARGDFASAMAFLRAMHGLGLRGPPRTYAALAGALARGGCRAGLVQTMKQMLAAGVTPSDEVAAIVRDYARAGQRIE
ncbi:hypothetical protein H4R18_003458 [Coemansia javaensis]|uniref:Pentacotripeptide-repeat region of PRORP domain-containing protein n=1 Tax=Coemansia javaensis TaxID=2761396 RepID=A0A9W8LIJ8_9FUNG|nr:hypothetical protein H4R18_003458 [Coemansia javaensis]